MTVDPFLLERFFAEHEFTAPHLLSVSDCESMTVGELLALEEGAADALAALRLGYTESEGSPTLRAALSGTHPGLTPDDFLVHGAGVEVLLTVALAVLEPGDHAVVQGPCYQAARSAPRIAGAEVTLWKGEAERGWAPDLEELPGLLTHRTRLLVINTPHNPTGHHFSLEELEWIVALTDEREVQLLVDEAYRGAEYRDRDVLPPASTLSDRAASLGVLSKAFGLPGLRTAWLSTRNARLREAVARAKDYTTICSPAPSESLAGVALRHADSILGRTRRRLARNLESLEDFMARHRDRFEWIPPRAGSVCMPLLRSGDAETFCRSARDEAGVLLAPGRLFDAPAAGLRFGFGREGFAAALSVFEDWLTTAA